MIAGSVSSNRWRRSWTESQVSFTYENDDSSMENQDSSTENQDSRLKNDDLCDSDQRAAVDGSKTGAFDAPGESGAI